MYLSLSIHMYIYIYIYTINYTNNIINTNDNGDDKHYYYLAWLSSPFRLFSVSPFWHYARSITFPLFCLPFWPTQCFDNYVFLLLFCFVWLSSLFVMVHVYIYIYIYIYIYKTMYSNTLTHHSSDNY